MTIARSLPYDLNAERAVLGGLLLENEALPVVCDLPLRASDFYRSEHGITFEAMLALHGKGTPVDSVTLRERLAMTGELERVGGDAFLLALTDTIPTVANIEAHAEIVCDRAQARRIIQACHESAARGYGDYGTVAEFADDAQTRLARACDDGAARAQSVSLGAAVDASFEELVVRAESPSKLRGYPTGLAKLDRILSGLCRGDLVIGAARPGMGKTALALGAARATAGAGVPVLFISLEMPERQLAERMLAAETPIDLRRLRNATIARDEWNGLTTAAQRLSELPIEIVDDPAVNVLDMRRRARNEKRKRPALGLVVVDYLQLARSGTRNDSREQEVSEISRQLKLLAKQENVCVLALSQLNRGPEGRADHRPMLADIRESGAIEQDADVVLGLYREEVYEDSTPSNKGIAEIIVLKQRNGPTGVARVRWSGEYTRFDNLEDGHP